MTTRTLPAPAAALPTARPQAWRRRAGLLAGVLALAAALGGCGGGDPLAAASANRAGVAAADPATRDAADPTADAAASAAPSAADPGAAVADASAAIGRATRQSLASVAASAAEATTTLDAARLANQATFGATNAVIAEIRKAGPAKWIAQQMLTTRSVYPAVGSDAVDRWTGAGDWCANQFADGTTARQYCWRDYYTATPMGWHFYRQAIGGKDQLRQRVAWALSQWLVVSDTEVYSAYGMREWHQMLRDRALGNYRDLLREVILSPVMGAFLNNVDNGKTDPNENFARELLQLFSLGTCQLNRDGTLKTGSCIATYDNARVREYAYALSGWTYPVGGSNYWCAAKCGWRNVRYFKGRMVAVEAQHDSAARSLLSGVTVAAGSSAAVAVERVLDSLMKHPNLAPFVARRLIQHFVTSNPSPAYVEAVATAFETGLYADIGRGLRGDLAATVAAVLLHPEARDPAAITRPAYGRLREPVQAWTAAMRALDVRTDGIWWTGLFGRDMGQAPFSPPSVFSYYAPDAALVGTPYVAPAMGIENEATTLSRLSLIQYLSIGAPSNGQVVAPTATVAGSIGTTISHQRWLPAVDNSALLVNQISLLLTASQLTVTQKAAIVAALDAINPTTFGSYWQTRRLRVAVFLVMACPQFSIVR
ncbi:DUF1800 domain-containing protein [Derxia lacustris]|uniref:DUF1800 domain-containing protein n=1 Tax=Derxia lacustris TaxID=764842 RepID=UPI00111BF143|nr:DUF1800 family protein [Derxia lacustris]